MEPPKRKSPIPGLSRPQFRRHFDKIKIAARREKFIAAWPTPIKTGSPSMNNQTRDMLVSDPAIAELFDLRHPEPTENEWRLAAEGLLARAAAGDSRAIRSLFTIDTGAATEAMLAKTKKR